MHQLKFQDVGSPPTKKRKRFTNAEKAHMLNIIKENQMTHNQAEMFFQVSHGFISNLLHHEQLINQRCQGDDGWSSKKISKRRSPLETFNAKVVNWIDQMNHFTQGNAVTDNSIRENARMLQLKVLLYPSNTTSNEEFEAIKNLRLSNGWLYELKKKNLMYSCRLQGQEDLINLSLVINQMEHINATIEGVEDACIFNLDEFGLFYKAGYCRTIQRRTDNRHTLVENKQRITVSAIISKCRDKLPLIVIGISRNPRCLKGIDTLKQFGVEYTSQQNAWQDTTTLKPSLIQLERRAREQDKTFYLIMDACSIHVATVKQLDPHGSKENHYQFGHLTILFLPSGTTSKTQPLDRGLIHAVKSYYRYFQLLSFHQYLSTRNETKYKSLAQHSTLKNALYWLSEAWKKLPDYMVGNSFIDCFVNYDKDVTNHNQSEVEINEIHQIVNDLHGINLAELIKIDDDLSATQPFFIEI